MTPAYTIGPELDARLDRWQRPALLGGGILLLVSIIGAIFDPVEFFHSYLFSYLFWLGLALGSMALIMTYYLTGGAWGVVTRRTFESATRTLPVLALLFIPIAVGIPYLYPWSLPDAASVEVLHHRSPYMNVPLFIARAITYFAVWLALAHFLNRWSREEDDGGERRRLARLSAPGLIAYVFTITFASVDWAKSLAVHWFSTMWGFLFVAGQGLAALSFVILMLAALSRHRPMSSVLRPSHFHDLGKLLLTFVMLWAYFQFSQLLIVWSGNLTSEIPWYIRRLHTPWGWVSASLLVIQFAIPFLMLLSRPLKRNAWALATVACVVLVMRAVDLFWVVMPEIYPAGLGVHWLNLSVPFALGGIWFSAFLSQLKKRPLLPLGDPNLPRALRHGEH